MPAWAKVCGTNSTPVGYGNQSKSSIRKHLARRKVLPGYPWEGKFATIEEINNYFDGDRLICLLCGKPFKRLAWHLPKIHGYTEDQYRERYGLPFRRGLTCSKTKEKYSKATKKRMADGTMYLITPKDRAKAHLAAKSQRFQPFRRDLTIKNSLKVHGLEVEYKKEDAIKVLNTMVLEDKLLSEVCKRDETPSQSWMYSLMNKDPSIKGLYEDALEKLSYATLASGEMLPSKFTNEVIALNKAGRNQYEIARMFGVHVMTINKHLHKKAREGAGG